MILYDLLFENPTHATLASFGEFEKFKMAAKMAAMNMKI